MKEGDNQEDVGSKKIGIEYFSARNVTEIRDIWVEKEEKETGHPQQKMKMKQKRPSYQRK